MHIMSFDIEEWHNYKPERKGDFLGDINKVLDQLLDVLEEYQVPATFFCLGVLGRKHAYLIKNIAERGHQIGCHSDMHYKLWQLDKKQMAEDTSRAIGSIEQLIGKKVEAYRAPAFSINKNNIHFLEILAGFGIKYDSSILPAKHDFGGFPEFDINEPCIIEHNGVKIKEFPIPVVNFWGSKIAFSGGGYFRILPYQIIKSMLIKRSYSISYLHIHDFYGTQKRIISPRYFKSYFGNKRSFPKFIQLIQDFQFTDIKKANELINWNSVPVVNTKNL